MNEILEAIFGVGVMWGYIAVLWLFFCFPVLVIYMAAGRWIMKPTVQELRELKTLLAHRPASDSQAIAEQVNGIAQQLYQINLRSGSSVPH